MPSGLLYHNTLDRSISKWRDVWSVLLLPYFKDISVLNANSVDPVCAVCQCPFYGKLGIERLKYKTTLCTYVDDVTLLLS